MSQYETWRKTKRAGCQCDYCIGNFIFLSFNGDLHKIDGTKLTDDEAQCQSNKQPFTSVVQPVTINRLLETVPIAVRAALKSTGHNCKRCNERNDYAEANQVDGTYVCFNCR